jgi:hypothetical protein
MFQQRGYVKVRIGDDMEALLDQAMNICAIDFSEWNEDSDQRGVEVSRHRAPLDVSSMTRSSRWSVLPKTSARL